jgi:TonB-linked SusC/RagA family outer membrane protein
MNLNVPYQRLNCCLKHKTLTPTFKLKLSKNKLLFALTFTILQANAYASPINIGIPSVNASTGSHVFPAPLTSIESSPKLKPAKPPIDIRGRVLDEKGTPLPGASVKVKGSPQGTMTDSNGSFSLKGVSSDAVLVISFVGYDSREVKAAATVNVSLQPNKSDLAEVTVIGYGTQRKSEVTGSISSVKGSALAEQPVTSFEGALGGRASGVNVTVNSGNLNEPPVFRIRGTNSLSLSSYPLVVIDGVPSFTGEEESGIGNASNNPLSSINPADIESIDIAKDAAATSIYGSRAANGVVFVTTKKGRMGKAKVNFSSTLNFNTAANLPKLLNAEQYIELKNEGLRNEGTFNPATNYYDYSLDANGNRVDTRWYDHIYRTGLSTFNNVNISGATESTKYYASVGYTDQEGIFRKTDFSRKSALFNIDNKTTNWLSIGAKINYNNELNASAMSNGSRGNQSASGGMSRVALISAPIVGPFNADGTYNTTTAGFLGLQDNASHLSGQSRLGFYNPVLSMDYNSSDNRVNSIQSNAYIEIKPLSWLSFKSIYGIDYRYVTFENYFSPLTGEAISTNGASASVQSRRERWVWTNTLSADKRFGDHSFNFLLGEEEQKTNGNQFGVRVTGQTDPLYTNTQGGWQNVFLNNTANSVFDNYLFSLFTRLQYNYQQRYFLTGNYRVDEYSALGANNKKGTFWGFSAGWDVAKESFWSQAGLENVVNSLKFRASYGKVGNVGGLSDFGAINTYSAALYGGQSGLIYSATGNSDLRWETSKKTDFGVNFGLFGNKITGELAYYRNNIDGLIFGVPLPPSVGIPNSNNNSIMQNVGRMYNQGVEFSIGGAPIRKENFSWNANFNLTTNKNQVLELAEGVPSIITGTNDALTITLPGYSAGMLYAVRTGGVDAATGRRIFLDKSGRKVYYQHVAGAGAPSPYQWSYEDNTQAPAITPSSDAVIYQQSAPKVFGGLSNVFNYKGFELNILLTYQLGGYMINGTQASLRDNRFWNNEVGMLRRWQQPGQQTDIPKVINGDNVSNGNTMPLDINVSSTDFLRLKSAQLSYNLPSTFISKFKLTNTRVFVSGQNLWLLTKYSGIDPEVTTNANSAIGQGIDKNQSPNARTIVVGLNFGF